MKVLVLETYYTGSHKTWCDLLEKYSEHEIRVLSLSGRHWKWRMQMGAVELVRQFEGIDFDPDLIIASDMVDLVKFKGLVKGVKEGVKYVLYLHENQLTYPWSSADTDQKEGRDNHYALINVNSCLAADEVVFNSQFHKDLFVESINPFIKLFPNFDSKWIKNDIEEKSSVLYLGIEMPDIKTPKQPKQVPIILWNHRWEYDKGPEVFFDVLSRLKHEGFIFQLIVLGEEKGNRRELFEEMKIQFSEEIVHWGYAESKEEYWSLLTQADILPVTSIQENFGLSVLEAVLAGVRPVLPNRLCYPELYYKSFQNSFYEDDGELFTVLKSYLSDSKGLLGSVSCDEYLERFDCVKIVKEYDDFFNSLMV